MASDRSVHNAITLLRHAARVSPELRNAAEIVERRLAFLDDENDRLSDLFAHWVIEATLLRSVLADLVDATGPLEMRHWPDSDAAFIALDKRNAAIRALTHHHDSEAE